MKKIICIAAICLLAQGAQAIQADIVFVVDESGSMSTVQTNIRNNIGTFASILSAGGIDAKYALVGYGSSTVRPRILTDFTDETAFATAAQGLLINGLTEPAYESIMAALNGGPSGPIGGGLTYRAGAVKNVIIVTDEPSNGDLAGASYATADALLKSNTALLNGILTSGSAGSSTPPSLRALVDGNGGTVFSLTTFNTNDQNVIDAFVTDFANRKLQEIRNVIPEPGTLVLLGGGLGLLGFATIRRRRNRKAA